MELPRQVNSAVAHILKRCLEKEPEYRAGWEEIFHSTDELIAAIKAKAKDGLSSTQQHSEENLKRLVMLRKTFNQTATVFQAFVSQRGPAEEIAVILFHLLQEQARETLQLLNRDFPAEQERIVQLIREESLKVEEKVEDMSEKYKKSSPEHYSAYQQGVN